METLLHWSDIPVLVMIAAAVLLPEFVRGFSQRPATLRLAILTACCVVAVAFGHYLQGADPGALFTRAFLLAITARISLLLNHITHAMLSTWQQKES